MYFSSKTVTLLILAQVEKAVRPAASLRHTTTQFIVVLLCCLSLHDDMKFIAAFFFSLKLLVQSSKKSQRKKKSLQHYRAKHIKRQLYGKYYKMFVSKNDPSKWPARLEYDRSSPRSGRTLSIDRLLFWALDWRDIPKYSTWKHCILLVM